MSDKSIQILLVDDHAIVREGYRSLLQKQPNISVIADARDAAEAYQNYKTFQPDVVIMDISMPGQSGLEAISRIRQYDGQARILVFSMHQNPSFALQAIRAGALGYITKSSDPALLIHGIYQVYENKLSLSPDVAQALALEKLGQDKARLDDLTVREFEILRLLLEAKNNQQIADILNISPKTVSNSHYIIKRKLEVNSDIELTRLAIRMKLLNLRDLIDEAE
ncbi:response regulator [Methylophaga pinxianii]|uniref:response regulator n=1 Tax=Methylophaga pinxianii TaxID=2881052 RepID=UPI001CF48518|nr:response regulator transcription factor [Methylophaga pinxianii]MCB2427139.1 response regulator transcription factor [Methylophaga pinxianii]UPH44959.1 response regulator transcription factor [Methylophaga pinxianii]